MTLADRTALAQKGLIVCSDCAGTRSQTTHYDYARGNSRTEFCLRCDGRQTVYVGMPRALASISFHDAMAAQEAKP